MVLKMSKCWFVWCLYCCFFLMKVKGQTETETETELEPEEVDDSASSSLCASSGSSPSPPLKLDLIIVLDSSGSVGSKIWPQEVGFAKKLVNHLPVGQDQTHIGVIDFSSKSILRVDMNKPEGASNDTIQQKLDELKTYYQGGVTKIDLALYTSIEMYKNVPSNRNARKLLVIVTDGKATSRKGVPGFELMKAPINILRLMNVDRIAIGVGKRVKIKELEQIASYKGNVILVSTFAELLKDVTRVMKTLCQPAKIDECAIGNHNCDTNADCTDTDESFSCVCKAGYTGDGTSCSVIKEEGCPRNADLVIILDCSGSIGPWNWLRQLAFVRSLVKNITLSQEKTRIGLVIFHETVKVYVDIKDGWSENNVFSALKDLEYVWAPYMRTYTDLALNKAVEMIDEFTKSYPRLVLLMTDGETSFWRKGLLKKPVETLQSNGVEVVSVGIGPRINFEELLYICKRKDRIFMTKNYIELVKDIKKISTKLCEMN